VLPDQGRSNASNAEPNGTTEPRRAPNRVHPCPSGEQFIFARWEEITRLDAPWWTRSTGVGLRLRLSELLDLAGTASAGGVAKSAISRLVREARRALCSGDSYLTKRFKAAAEDISRSLRDDSAESWVPAALGPSAIGAALQLIDTPNYLPTLVDDLAADATAIKDLEGSVEIAKAFTRLEVLVELLDAELVYEGHSLAWRRRVLEDARRHHHEDHQPLGDAMRTALTGNRCAETRSFDVLVPVAELEDPPGGRSGIVRLDPDKVIVDIVETWLAKGTESILSHSQLTDAVAVIRYEQLTAVDVEAAARKTNEAFGRDADIWRLRGGIISPGEIAFVYDSLAHEAFAVSLPAEPLDLLPRSLASYSGTHDSTRPDSAIDDALLQLARARTAAPAIALVSLWTAAEALFAGAVGDARSDAAHVMAALGEFLYLRDLFAWLSEHYTSAGLDRAPEGESSRWGLDRTLEKTTEVLDRLSECSDVLAWWRVKTLTRWGVDGQLREQLTALSDRMEQVAARAYLVRNMLLHRAEARERALAVTLPPFAGLVRECVGHVANLGPSPEVPLRTAKAAALRVRHAANQVESGHVQAHEAIRALLGGWIAYESRAIPVAAADEPLVIKSEREQEVTQPTTVPIEDVDP
jgi:hypothetical protein